jgi:hypothetical protein
MATHLGGDAAGDPHRADRVPGRRRPVAAGYVDSLARPGGNVTGFMTYEYSLSGKRLEPRDRVFELRWAEIAER